MELGIALLGIYHSEERGWTINLLTIWNVNAMRSLLGVTFDPGGRFWSLTLHILFFEIRILPTQAQVAKAIEQFTSEAIARSEREKRDG